MPRPTSQMAEQVVASKEWVLARNLVSGMLRQGLYTRVVGRRIVSFHRLSSTMDESTRLAEEGAQEGTVVLAEEQTAARGRFRRTWVSPAGNINLSIVLRPSPRSLQYLSIISGVAVARAIKKTTGLEPTLKWPNDVRIRGKKVSGILVENAFRGGAVEYAILGIGINVAFDPTTVDGLADRATSLNIEAGADVDRETLLGQLLYEIDRLYRPLRQTEPPSGPTYGHRSREVDSLERALQEWRSLLDTLGSRVEVRWQDEVYAGYAEDVDQVGNLLLRLNDGSLASLPAGEVTSAVALADKG